TATVVALYGFEPAGEHWDRRTEVVAASLQHAFGIGATGIRGRVLCERVGTEVIHLEVQIHCPRRAPPHVPNRRTTEHDHVAGGDGVEQFDDDLIRSTGAGWERQGRRGHRAIKKG